MEPHKFNVGDRVRVRESWGTTSVFNRDRSGKEGTVTRVGQEDRLDPYVTGGNAGRRIDVRFDDGKHDYGRAWELTRISAVLDSDEPESPTGAAPSSPQPIGFRDGAHMVCENSLRTHLQVVHTASGRSFEIARGDVSGLQGLLSHIDSVLPPAPVIVDQDVF